MIHHFCGVMSRMFRFRRGRLPRQGCCQTVTDLMSIDADASNEGAFW